MVLDPSGYGFHLTLAALSSKTPSVPVGAWSQRLDEKKQSYPKVSASERHSSQPPQRTSMTFGPLVSLRGPLKTPSMVLRVHHL